MNIIRPAVLSDVEGMSVVVDSAWRENYKDFFTEEQIAAYTGEHRRKSFTGLLNNGKDVFVLLVDGVIIAVCSAAACEETPFEGCAEIILLYVLPEYQRRGFGQELLSHVLMKMRKKGFKGAVLSTADKNANARRFYEKFGFTERSSKEFDGVVYITYSIDF